MNKILEAQVSRFLGDQPETLAGLQPLLHEISLVYDQFEAFAGSPSAEHNNSTGLISDILALETERRKSAERDKERLVARLEACQKSALIGSWELDLDCPSARLLWSDETFRILGFEPQSVVPSIELFFSMVPLKDRTALQQKFDKCIATGQLYEVEHRIITADGRSKILAERGEIILDPETGKPQRLSGTCQDVTVRRRGEEQLRKAHHELKTLFENMQECAFTLDPVSNRIVQISPSCMEIYGYTPDEFMRHPQLWRELMLEEDRQAVPERFRQLRDGGTETFVYRIRDKKGHIKWLESRIKPTLDGNVVTRLDGITADITKRYEAKQALLSSEYRFRSMIEHSTDAIVVLNEALEVTYISDSLTRNFGYTRADSIGRSAVEFAHPDDVAVARLFFRTLLQSPGDTMTSVYRRRHKDGRYLWCEGSATNLLHHPAVHGIIFNFRDITHKKESDEALLRSNEELKKINFELDKFVYSVSHDLRAPLSSMLGIVNLIETREPAEDIRKDLDLLTRSIRRLDGFILDILDYSRNARTEVTASVVDFNHILSEIRQQLVHMSPAVSDRDIRVEVREQVPFQSDETRLMIVLNNLLSNAIRYSDPQPDKIPFVSVRVETSPDKAVIQVADNGIGIAPEHLENIFAMFYRVSRKSVGSGLGLYIVRETVSKLGGTIRVESEPGQGTCFTIELPNIQTSIC